MEENMTQRKTDLADVTNAALYDEVQRRRKRDRKTGGFWARTGPKRKCECGVCETCKRTARQREYRRQKRNAGGNAATEY